VAELDLPRKNGQKYLTRDMTMRYCELTRMMFVLENLEDGYRIVILTFKEFSVNFTLLNNSLA